MKEHNCEFCKQSFISNSKLELVRFCCKKCADNSYTIRNKAKKIEYDRLRHLNNPEIRSNNAKRYRQEHKSERYPKEKIILDGSFSKRFYKNALTGIKNHFRFNRKQTKSKLSAALGYDFSELKQHLISTLPNGFSWDDYIKTVLHLDHIKAT